MCRSIFRFLTKSVAHLNIFNKLMEETYEKSYILMNCVVKTKSTIRCSPWGKTFKIDSSFCPSKKCRLRSVYFTLCTFFRGLEVVFYYLCPSSSSCCLSILYEFCFPMTPIVNNHDPEPFSSISYLLFSLDLDALDQSIIFFGLPPSILSVDLYFIAALTALRSCSFQRMFKQLAFCLPLM